MLSLFFTFGFVMPAEHPLLQLQGRPLGGGHLEVAGLRSGSRSGWTHFRLLLKLGRRKAIPLVNGIYSKGGRGVRPWIEVLSYAPPQLVTEGALDSAPEEYTLFCYLSELIPPGGHLMLGCEDPTTQETHKALIRGIPPVATALGALLFRVGFCRVKFFYLPEGGWEGPQKLWAEKPPDAATARIWDTATAEELRCFLNCPRGAPSSSVTRAMKVLKELEDSRPSEGRKAMNPTPRGSPSD